MNKSASQILQEARALLAQGWCQGQLRETKDGKAFYCIVGSLGRATESRAERFEVMAVLSRHLPDAHRWQRDPVSFNDHPKTTQADVLAVFDRALTEVTK